MPSGTCDCCASPSLATFALLKSHYSLCKRCATPAVDFIDGLLADGMELFSAEGSEHCANCLAAFTEEQPVRLAIGPWRRHALCSTCAEPIVGVMPARLMTSMSAAV